uniref:Uncharacterized protein n=1 Tax=Lepeophtheirus salmonis TaxID=72036 RepID=A0A0K2SV90_LEPSM
MGCSYSSFVSDLTSISSILLHIFGDHGGDFPMFFLPLVLLTLNKKLSYALIYIFFRPFLHFSWSLEILFPLLSHSRRQERGFIKKK